MRTRTPFGSLRWPYLRWSARLALPLTATLLAAGSLAGDKTDRVSISSAGDEADASSSGSVVSGSGRYVAFSSSATNLVAGDTNAVDDVFFHDRKTGTTTRMSVSTSGVEGDDDSAEAGISPNGRYVVFASFATNLAGADTNGVRDAFLHDRKTGVTTRVSVTSAGAEGDDASLNPSITPSGRFVVFNSFATNMVAGDGNLAEDVFFRDLKAGVTTRVSVASDGTEGNASSNGPKVSANGRYVVFSSDASNLVAGDDNGFTDVFVRDRKKGLTTRVSVTSAGAEATGGRSYFAEISANGRFVAFISEATNLAAGDVNGTSDIFIHDSKTGTTTPVSVSTGGVLGNAQSFNPAISAKGRFVAFWSQSTNLVANDANGVQDIFRHDVKTGATILVSVASSGTQGDATSAGPGISATGRFVVFESDATNLVSGDVNGVRDIFVRDTK